MVFTKTNITMYVDSKKTAFSKWNGMMDGKTVTSASGFDYGLLLELLSSSPEIYLGKGSFWGSPDAMFDDFIVYNRSLFASEVSALGRMENRMFDFNTWATPVEGIRCDTPTDGYQQPSTCYDLQGRLLPVPLKQGLYIEKGARVKVKNGK